MLDKKLNVKNTREKNNENAVESEQILNNKTDEIIIFKDSETIEQKTDKIANLIHQGHFQHILTYKNIIKNVDYISPQKNFKANKVFYHKKKLL